MIKPKPYHPCMNTLNIAQLDSYEILPLSDKPSSCVIFLHGYGADGKDLIGIGKTWQAALPETVFLSPDAPYPCEMSAFGRQWFSLADYTIPAMEREIQVVWPKLESYITTVSNHYNIPLNKIILCGFSQGTMMALYIIPRLATPLGGVLGYSGRLLDEKALAAGKNTETPVYLVHGEADPVVPIESWHHAHANLKNHGYTVDGYTTPHLPHGIDEEGIEKGLTFIRQAL